MSRKRGLLVLCAAALLVAACGSSKKTVTPPTSTPASASTAARGSGPVNVLYAGSLVNLMEKQIGPAFNTATGYSFTGFSAGSSALASEIKSKEREGDVFISASPSVNASLMGAANGNWVGWYASFATAPLVIGYNPHSKFARDLRTKPWNQVITEPGFLLGRTDPKTDPKGKLTVTALTDAAKTYSEPALSSISSSKSNVFLEESLVARLKAGQLDAGFFYTSETVPAGIPTVQLTGLDLKATYTITVLNQAPHQAAAEAFVTYLLRASTQAVLSSAGFHLITPPTIKGSGVPASISSAISG